MQVIRVSTFQDLFCSKSVQTYADVSSDFATSIFILTYLAINAVVWLNFSCCDLGLCVRWCSIFSFLSRSYRPQLTGCLIVMIHCMESQNSSDTGEYVTTSDWTRYRMRYVFIPSPLHTECAAYQDFDLGLYDSLLTSFVRAHRSSVVLCNTHTTGSNMVCERLCNLIFAFLQIQLHGS